MIRLSLIFFGVSLTFAAAPSIAAAATPVPADQRVKDIRVVGQTVRVDGTVDDRAIVIDGDLVVGPHGRVSDPILLGGRLRVEPGGTVRGDVLHLGTSWPAISSLGAWLLVAILLTLRLAVAWAVVSTAAVIARRPLGGALMAAGCQGPARTLLTGALTAFGLLTACLLLAFTLVGLPVALPLAGLLLAGTAAGVSLVIVASGEEPAVPRIALVALAVPVFGDALAALATVSGLGAGLRYIADVRPGMAHAPPASARSRGAGGA